MRFIPSGPRVLVKLDAVEEKKVGAIFVPDSHSERARVGVILARGEDARRYAVGDRVFMGFHNGEVIDDMVSKADTLRVMHEDEIWGWVTED